MCTLHLPHPNLVHFLSSLPIVSPQLPSDPKTPPPLVRICSASASRMDVTLPSHARFNRACIARVLTHFRLRAHMCIYVAYAFDRFTIPCIILYNGNNLAHFQHSNQNLYSFKMVTLSLGNRMISLRSRFTICIRAMVFVSEGQLAL